MNIEAAALLAQVAKKKTTDGMKPVHGFQHYRLTKAGYRHKANYEPTDGKGRFGYYEHPVTKHRIVVDESGQFQDEMQPQQNGRGGGQQRQGQGGMRAGGGK